MGPLLFIIFVNDVTLAFEVLEIEFFSDVTMAYYCEESLDLTVNKFKKVLKQSVIELIIIK